jgi:hypothetical protein
VAELTAELGGNLPVMKRLLVEQLARLKLRAKVDDVRTARAMTMIMKALGIEQRKSASPPAGETLGDVLQELAADARSNGGGG